MRKSARCISKSSQTSERGTITQLRLTQSSLVRVRLEPRSHNDMEGDLNGWYGGLISLAKAEEPGLDIPSTGEMIKFVTQDPERFQTAVAAQRGLGGHEPRRRLANQSYFHAAVSAAWDIAQEHKLSMATGSSMATTNLLRTRTSRFMSVWFSTAVSTNNACSLAAMTAAGAIISFRE